MPTRFLPFVLLSLPHFSCPPNLRCKYAIRAEKKGYENRKRHRGERWMGRSRGTAGMEGFWWKIMLKRRREGWTGWTVDGGRE